MATNKHTITRRLAIGGTLASGVVAMTLATASEADPVIDMGREYFSLKQRYDDIERAYKAGAIGEDAFERVADDVLSLMWDTYDRITVTEAKTLRGVAMQARVLQAEAANIFQFEDGKEAALIGNIVSALEKNGG